VNAIITQRPEHLSITQACHALAVNRSTLYARQARATHDEPLWAMRSTKSCVARSVMADSLER